MAVNFARLPELLGKGRSRLSPPVASDRTVRAQVIAPPVGGAVFVSVAYKSQIGICMSPLVVPLALSELS
jgi:hypothetical protein